jgi:Ti-type conjugative transfer relaxase TraA
MLSISQPIKGSGHSDYYMDLAREDYYTGGGEPPGQWQGQGAEALGLTGKVEAEHLKGLFEGYSPDGEALVQNAGHENRHSAWDLTFSAPKSVSVLWSQASPEVRQEIQAAHGEAVKEALSYLESEAASTRRGKAGSEVEPASLVVATFEHGTSRAQDPQLHTHALVLNVAVREDGSTGALETKGIFAHKMAAGALYRAELSAQLEERLGLTSTKVKSWFEVDHVPESLQEEFSKRRHEIEKVLEEKGTSGAVASKIANLESRQVKEHTARETLFSGWQEVGKAHGWSTQEVTALTQMERPQRDKATELKECIDTALTKLTDRSSHFTKRDLTRAAAEEAQGRGLSSKEVVSGVASVLSSQEVVPLGVVNRENRYTTKEMLAVERELIEGAIARKDEQGITVSNEALEKALANHDRLSPEQKAATQFLTQGTGGVRIVSGLAGTGKSSSLSAAREAWESEGYKVIGAAPQGKAARELELNSGISSTTLHQRLYDVENGKLTLDSKTVLVVDEAAMVGTRLQNRISKIANASGAQVILSGDEKQLQSVQAGGAFSYFSEKLGRAEINTIRRQEEGWAREAVYDFAHGKAEEALQKYAERGLVSVNETRKDSLTSLIADWKDRGVVEPHKHIMLAGTNSDVRELNEKAQSVRFAEGKIGNESVKVERTHYHQGDRVLFTKNSRKYGVENGTLGTIEKISSKSMTARLDDGRKATIDLENYKEIKLGYAITTHKAQGTTVENAYVFLGGNMQDRELSYVQASRAKNETRFYIDKSEAGENLKDLTKQMGQSREKTLATTLIEKGNKQGTAHEQRQS